jgi:hypothetical protein
MRKLNIYYCPLSSDLSHPADRRRIVRWAKTRRHNLQIDNPDGVDVRVLSQGCNFPEKYFLGNIPVILDLVDSVSLRNSIIDDLARGLLKIESHERWRLQGYSHFIRERSRIADGVICSSEEQKAHLVNLNKNTVNILDSHDEIPPIVEREKNLGNSYALFWEGQPHTLKPLTQIQNAIQAVNLHVKLNIVTDNSYYRFLNSFGKTSTDRTIRKLLDGIPYDLSSWNLQNLYSKAKKSNLAVIPVAHNRNIQKMKPENRLMLMFRLGLPVACSRTPSHLRVESKLGIKITCESTEEWIDLILKYLHNKDYSEHAIRLGKKYLLEHHNDEVLFSKWDAAIASVL